MLTVESSTKFDWKNIGLVECMRGNAMDTYFTAKIYEMILEKIKEKGLEKLYEKLIAEALPIFARMELDGFLIDTAKLADLKERISRKIKTLDSAMMESPRIPMDANLNSSRDLISILYSLKKNSETKEWDVCEDIGFGLYPIEFTDAGQPKTDEEVLIKIKEVVDAEVTRRGKSNEKE
jgi:DNA polymerase I-like protein with 3'-5' exonuclease and polymerase domains